jgi:hypothetical protein
LFQYSLCCRTSIGFELPRLCHSFRFIGGCSILSVFLWDLEIFKLQNAPMRYHHCLRLMPVAAFCPW